MKIFLPILFLTTIACGLGNSKTFSEKHPIHINSVEIIYIKKSFIDKDSVQLTEEQIEAFVKKWNNSESVGLNKYRTDFWITLKEKKGDIRKFRMNKDRIKENSDWTFSIGDTAFINKVWKSNNVLSRL